MTRIYQLIQQLETLTEDANTQQAAAEATGDRSFDDMMKTVKKGTLKQATADRRETRKQSQQQARDAFGTMFGGGNPASDLKIKEQGVAEAGMSRAAKGYEKYGKAGMTALAKAGREGASEKTLDTIRSKHDKYSAGQSPVDESSVDENKVSDFVRGQNYKRLARRSGDRATDALDAAIDTGSAADSDEFAKQQDQYTARKQRAKSLGASVDESIVVLPPNFPDDMPEEEQRAAWRKWLRNETNKAVAAQTDIQQLAKQLRKQQQEKRNRGESDYMPEAADQNQMDTPEFQQALANLKKKAAQGPSKVAWDPKTSRYRVVPVNDNTMKESVTKEDIITKLKATLGDYLSDVAQAVRKDSDLKDPGSAQPSSVGAVKTIMTDDGHEIRIHGNEDDGFRITIKNKDATAKFASLSEAEMAANLYCAKRRQTPAAQAADYVSEETKDACYHKVKSRYKVWPSAYASGALVQCRKKGAANWGTGSKKK